MELKQYLDILNRRRMVFLVVFLAVTCLGALGSQLISPKYQAKALLRVVTPLGGNSGETNYQTAFALRLENTYAQIATSDQVKNELKQKLGLNELPAISVKVIPDSEIIQIIVESDNPALAARTANTLTDILISYQDNVVKSSSSEALGILDTRKSELQAELTQYQQQHDQLVQTFAQTTANMAILDREIKLKEASYQNLQGQYEQVIVSEAVFANSVTRITKNALMVEIEQIQKEMDELNQEYKDLSTKSSEYQQKIALIRQTIQNVQVEYSDLLIQHRNVSLAQSKQNARNLEVASVANEPSTPSGTSRSSILGLVVLCGSIAGIAAAFLAENMDTRIFSPAQIETITALPVIGNISNIENKTKITSLQQDPIIMRDYWMLSTKMQRLVKEKSIKTIMITSPNSLDGKSTVVYGLALEMAQSSSKILIVDANLRAPKQNEFFDAKVEYGLVDYLNYDAKDPRKAIIKNVSPGIDLLPCLPDNESQVNLLRTQKIEALFDAIQSYDVILIDTSALLTFPEALDMAKAVDGVIVVTRWGHTTIGDVKSICQYMESVGSEILGIVVNHMPRGKNFFYS